MIPTFSLAMHPQDRLLILEALSKHATDEYVAPHRRDRAEVLLEAIADDLGVDPVQFALEIDSDWPDCPC